MAGFLFWIAMALFVRTLPERAAMVYSFFATGAVFPSASCSPPRRRGSLPEERGLHQPRPPARDPAAFFWPVIIIVFGTARPWTPYVMAVLFCSHFLPYNWLYRSRGYAFLAVATGAISTAPSSPPGAPVPLDPADCRRLLCDQRGHVVEREQDGPGLRQAPLATRDS
jgi:hypothetical protein